ncbi:MAG: TIGR00730 family Rossman fold protein [Gammaproteobacteria bacterium]|nr:MAG: TIGR00730 family Rossman fold protein [Gammaproteobacteria bacterium]
MKNIAIFCGSNMGSQTIYRDAAEKLATALIQSNINLIYGGASVGLMGVIADTMLQAGGKVIGVIPQALAELEVAHNNLTHLHIVDDMHARKKLMSDLADAFIMLPGGTGSWDEFFEIFTWRKLGFHMKPCGIVNTHHYFDHLIHFLDHSVKEGFLNAANRDLIFIEESPLLLVEKLTSHYLKVPITEIEIPS